MTIRSWLEKKFASSQQVEAEQFLTSLRGADNDLLDMIAGAQLYWAAFYSKKGIDLYEMETWIQSRLMFPSEIAGLIKGLQKQRTTGSVPGLMVWLHSSRALLWPELRLAGRQIWQELSKATDMAERLAVDMCIASHVSIQVCDRRRIPGGLEAIRR